MRESKKCMHELIQAEQTIARNAEVVVSTCDTSGNVVLRDLRFKTILIDEASQAVEPETWFQLFTELNE